MPLLLAAILSCPPGPAPLPSVRNAVAVIAHRGGAGIAPENTIAAVRRAVRLGADYVEVDVRTTADGHLVLMHDATVDRTTDGAGAVRSLTLEAIRALQVPTDQGGPERVPTLDEALRACRGRVCVYLDHKDADVGQVLAAIRRHRMERRVVVYDDPEGLRAWKRAAHSIPVMPSLPGEDRVSGGVARFLRTCPAEVLDGHLLEWNAELVAQAHAAGVKVYVDMMGATDNDAGYARAIEMGVDGLQTDYPDRLLAFLRRASPSRRR